MKNTVYLYIFDTMADWEVGYLTAELNSGRYFKKGKESLKILTMSNTKETIVTMGGLRIVPDIEIDKFSMNDAAALVLPGGNTWTDQIHNLILSIAEKCLNNGTIVAAICGATIGLARVGLLNQKYHTSNDLEFLKMICPNYIGEKYYKIETAVVDENLITASGIAPLDFTVHVLRKLDVFLPEVLDSWQQLYKTHDSKYFFEIMQLIK
ncbi:glutamine amidotransferase [Clostridium gasigenes]|uniref:type 1 glutamine amidotransferase family protein n=1 Tax=Clostridium gasigenes TaxID=94869 RepID=UPI001C0C3CC7|nr:type 1 glutamine amidotransferase family protein [Clostridium gasigenes]MBU3136383.1 glutamine amidotransferase [Clostridium gasigenes]